MSSPDIVTLDWRTALASSEILMRMQRLLTGFDHTGISTIELAEPSSSSLAVSLGVVDGVHMWVHARGARSQKVSTHHAFLSKFIVVGRALVKMVNYHDTRRLRMMQYMLRSKELSYRAARQIIYNWALSINVHPWSLGIVPLEDATVSVPPAVVVTCEILPNVFKRDEVVKQGLRGRRTHIPARIVKLHVTLEKGHNVRAVVVTEHRNMDFDLPATAKAFKNVIVVQVSVAVTSMV